MKRFVKCTEYSHRFKSVQDHRPKCFFLESVTLELLMSYNKHFSFVASDIFFCEVKNLPEPLWCLVVMPDKSFNFYYISIFINEDCSFTLSLKKK